MIDELDNRIMREMIIDPARLTFQADVRRSHRRIDRKLATTEDTIGNRLKALESSGYLRGWRAGVNPRLLGYRTSAFDFNPHPQSKSEALRHMRRMPGMLWLKEYYGDCVGGVVAHNANESLEQKLKGLLTQRNAETLVCAEVAFPTCVTKLDAMDWQVIGALQINPRKHYGQVAEELQVSSRTVRRRVEKMVNDKSMFILPDLDLKALEGTVKVSLVVEYANDHAKDGVDGSIIAKYERYLSFPLISDDKHASFVFNLPNLPLAEEMRGYVAENAGVRRVWVRPILSFINLLGEAFRHDITLRSGESEVIQAPV